VLGIRFIILVKVMAAAKAGVKMIVEAFLSTHAAHVWVVEITDRVPEIT
jgi:hypothetical protein